MANIEKWVNELQCEIDKIKRDGVGGGGGGGNAPVHFVTEYTTPEHDDELYILTMDNTFTAVYYAHDYRVIFLYGYYPRQHKVVDSDYTSFVISPCTVSDDNVSVVDVANKRVRLRSGGGSFTSFFKAISPANMGIHSGVGATYTFQGNEYTDTVDFSNAIAAGLFPSDNVYVGFYYETDSGGCRVGYAFYSDMLPDKMIKVPMQTGTGASGDIDIYEFHFVDRQITRGSLLKKATNAVKTAVKKATTTKKARAKK